MILNQSSGPLIVATKSELAESEGRYELHRELAVQAERTRNYTLALTECELAWQYVGEMMQFRRKYEDKTFASVPCIDQALRLAPLLLRSSTLDALQRLLKSEKSIDKHATDDLAQRLLQAREQLRRAYVAWNLIERTPGFLQSRLQGSLGGVQDQWRALMERWESMGMIMRQPESNSYRLWHTTNMDDRVRAKCPRCGATITGPKRAFLKQQACPSCKREAVHVITEQSSCNVEGDS